MPLRLSLTALEVERHSQIVRRREREQPARGEDLTGGARRGGALQLGHAGALRVGQAQPVVQIELTASANVQRHRGGCQRTSWVRPAQHVPRLNRHWVRDEHFTQPRVRRKHEVHIEGRDAISARESSCASPGTSGSTAAPEFPRCDQTVTEHAAAIGMGGGDGCGEGAWWRRCKNAPTPTPTLILASRPGARAGSQVFTLLAPGSAPDRDYQVHVSARQLPSALAKVVQVVVD